MPFSDYEKIVRSLFCAVYFCYQSKAKGGGKVLGIIILFSAPGLTFSKEHQIGALV